VHGSEESFVRGTVLTPTGDSKSNTIRARCEEHQAVQSDQVLELDCEHYM
jgi:diaminopimelate epimerase